MKRGITRVRDGVMLEIKVILCSIDFSEFSISAYHYALSVAEHYRAKLVAQHIVELWRAPSTFEPLDLGHFDADDKNRYH
jgi:hypothetical protein